MQAYTLGDDDELDIDNVEVIPAGATLDARGEVNMTFPVTASRKRFLRVSVTLQNKTLYLPFQMKGSFSPIAGQHNISGVHSARSLLEKFRLPIMVKLVHGLIPTKLEKHFTGAFRLLHIFTDQTVFVCPLKRDARMIPISTREPLKLAGAENIEDLERDEDFKFLYDKCSEMHASFMNSIHVLFSLPEPPDLSQNRRKLVSTKDGAGCVIPPDEEDVLFKEVEDIYQYVREGGPEPQPRPRPPTLNKTPAIQIVKIGSSNASNQELSPQSAKPNVESPRFTFKAISKVLRKSKNKGEKKLYVNSPDSIDGAPASPFDPPPDYPTFDFPEPDSGGEPNPPPIDYWEEPIYAPLDKFQKEKKI